MRIKLQRGSEDKVKRVQSRAMKRRDRSGVTWPRPPQHGDPNGSSFQVTTAVAPLRKAENNIFRTHRDDKDGNTEGGTSSEPTLPEEEARLGELNSAASKTTVLTFSRRCGARAGSRCFSRTGWPRWNAVIYKGKVEGIWEKDGKPGRIAVIEWVRKRKRAAEATETHRENECILSRWSGALKGQK